MTECLFVSVCDALPPCVHVGGMRIHYCAKVFFFADTLYIIIIIIIMTCFFPIRRDEGKTKYNLYFLICTVI